MSVLGAACLSAWLQSALQLLEQRLASLARQHSSGSHGGSIMAGLSPVQEEEDWQEDYDDSAPRGRDQGEEEAGATG